LEFKEGLTFDDVLLVPKYSDITSRSQTNLTTKLSRNISLNIPFTSANMDTVTESAMAVVMARAGGIGFIHRFLTIQEQANEVLKVKRSGSVIIENPYTINQDKTVQDAIDYANEKEVSGLLVVNSDSKLTGIVTDRDFATRIAANNLPFETPAEKIMSSPLITINHDSTIPEAAEMMNSKKIRKLAVTENNKIIGIITSTDLVNQLAK